jgi:hypothetical protein
MTFADIPLNEAFRALDGVVYVKLSATQAQGPQWRWRASSVFTFAPDDEVQEFSRWRVA